MEVSVFFVKERSEKACKDYLRKKVWISNIVENEYGSSKVDVAVLI